MTLTSESHLSATVHSRWPSQPRLDLYTAQSLVVSLVVFFIRNQTAVGSLWRHATNRWMKNLHLNIVILLIGQPQSEFGYKWKKRPYCDIVSLHSDINVHQRTLVIFGTDVAERSFIQLFIFPPYRTNYCFCPITFRVIPLVEMSTERLMFSCHFCWTSYTTV